MRFNYRSSLIMSLALLRIVVVAASTEWPEFRGSTAQGISAATNIPVEWNTTKNIAWTVEVPGNGWSSPVISQGRVYLTAAVPGTTSSGLSLRALAYDARDGKLLWNSDVLHPDPARAKIIHSKNGQASPTPIVRDGRIYVHFGHLGTAALDLNGKVLWTQATLGYPPIHGNGGSPLLVGSNLIFSCDAEKDPFVVALNASTGDIRWKTPRNTTARKKFSFSTPLLIQSDANQPVVVSPGSGFVAGYDPANGKELWKVRYGEGYSVVPRPVLAHGLLFLSSGFDNPVVYAIRVKGLKDDSTASNIAWTSSRGAPCTPSLLVVGDELYFVSDLGIATCADARTGRVHWSERLGGDFSSSPIFAEGRLYFQNETGIGFVVKAGKTFQLLSKNDLGERTLSSPAVVDGALLIRSESHLWKVAR